MNKAMKKILIILFFILVLVSIFFITYFLTKSYHDKQVIKEVTSIFTEDDFQNKIETTNEISSLAVNIDGYDIVGVIKIDKINFEGLVYEGTNLNILKKGVGHFESSPLTNR